MLEFWFIQILWSYLRGYINKIQHEMLSHYLIKKFCYKVKFRIISENYVILVVHELLFNYCNFPYVIDNIQCQIRLMRTLFWYTSKYNSILKRNMLAPSFTYNSSVTADQIEVIANIKYQLCILHQEEYLVQE